jgi:hypothetical protein
VLRLWVQLELTEHIEITNITANRLRNYFPDMTPAHAIRELFKIALDNGHIDAVHNAHRSDNFRGRF